MPFRECGRLTNAPRKGRITSQYNFNVIHQGVRGRACRQARRRGGHGNHRPMDFREGPRELQERHHRRQERHFGEAPGTEQAQRTVRQAELRNLWSAPDTRAKLLAGLGEKGFGHDQLAEMQKIIDAEKSDLFDVLAHVAYALPPVTREVRADHARVYINSNFNAKQQAFLDFVLSHYVNVGVEELNQDKLKPLLLIKYHNSIQDAVADLGKPDEISSVFAGFQKYLYQ